jgi:hypothetical protein
MNFWQHLPKYKLPRQLQMRLQGLFGSAEEQLVEIGVYVVELPLRLTMV